MDHHKLALAVLLPGFSGTTAPGWLLEAARDGLAGVVLFAQNTPELNTARALTDTLHQAYPGLLVMIDEEGGDVTRLQAGEGSRLPGAAAFGAAGDADLTRRGGRALGSLLRAAGVDVDLAPVLDVASEPRNPVIGVRAFGAEPEQVADQGVAFLTGLQQGGVAACGKHFPGHGATTVDSHLALPTLEAGVEVFVERDLPPFERAAAAGLDSVMTGHLHIPAIGPAPASLEPAVTDRVRGLPGGGDIAIITDALDMAAVAGANQETFGEACVQAIEAGADLLCLGSTANRDDEEMFRTAYDAIVAALDAGRISADHLSGAVRRTGVLRERVVRHRSAAEEISAEEAVANVAAVGEEAARRSVRVLRGTPQPAEQTVLVDLRRRINQAAGRVTPGFWRALQRRRPGSRILTPGIPESAPLRAELATVDPEAQLLVLTREPLADQQEQQMLDMVLRERPDAVIIHGGTAASAPEDTASGALVLAYGVGLANAEAVMDLVLGP